MNKNQKNSLILIIVIILIFIVAYFGYGALSKNSLDTSYKPTLNIDSQEVEDDIVEEEVSVEIDNDEEKNSTVENENIGDNQKDNSSDNEEAANSNIMPDIPLQLLNGEETTFWNIAQLGKPVVINSFASWCPPCKEEMPHFIEMSEKYKDDVVFIFFDSFDGERETMDKLNEFADKYFNDDTICVIDPGYISYLFKSNSLPTTILLNKKGEPVNGYQGMISEETLENAIIQLLNE